jgi:hypothetical protein
VKRPLWRSFLFFSHIYLFKNAVGGLAMHSFKIILICITCIYFLVYIILALRIRKPVRALLFTALCGILSMTAVNLSATLTGVYIPLNAYTAALVTSGGLPATVALILVRTIIGV